MDRDPMKWTEISRAEIVRDCLRRTFSIAEEAALASIPEIVHDVDAAMKDCILKGLVAADIDYQRRGRSSETFGGLDFLEHEDEE